MNRYTFYITTPFKTIEAETYEQAKQEAYKLLEYYAGSNDGSEWLANAELEEC